ncbi:LysM domain protein [compost metagenome]
MIVRSGDTLSRLAARHGVSAANLARWNNLRVSSKLKAGQRLSLVKTQRSSVVAAKSGKKMTQKSTQAKGKSVKRSTKKATIKPTRTASKKKARKN